MFQTICRKGLWISLIAILLIVAVQGLSGHWVTFFLIWPGSGPYAQWFTRAMTDLGSYHRVAGATAGVLSILILLLSFFSPSNLYVRIFALVGLAMTGLAVFGGYKFVTSGYVDRWSLGEMADAFVGVFTAFFIQLLLLIKTPRFLLNLGKRSKNSAS